MQKGPPRIPLSAKRLRFPAPSARPPRFRCRRKGDPKEGSDWGADRPRLGQRPRSWSARCRALLPVVGGRCRWRPRHWSGGAMLPRRSSLTGLAVGLFAVYVAHTCWVMYGIVHTRPCLAALHDGEGNDGCIRPYLARRPKLQLSVYTTTRSNIGTENNIDLVLNVENFDVETKFERTVNVSVPKKTRNNGTLYAFIFLHHAGILPWHDGKQVHIVSPLTTYMVPKPEEINLLTGESVTQQIEAEKKQTYALDEPVSHWRSRLTLNVMVEDFVFDGSSLPADVHRYMKMVQLGKTVHYLPILFIDQLSNRVKDLMIINRSTTELPLTVSYDKISLGKLRFWIHMQDAVYSLQQFGFSEKDADEVKGIFVDTNLYFLALTFFVAAFHLLFDFLAFKNDISFWKKKKSMIGMSTKAVLWRCFSTVIIFLFLLDEQTSLLVLIPAGIGAMIELWKVKKALKMTIEWNGLIPAIKFGAFTESEKKTEEYDTQAMKYLSYLLYPLCIGGAIYSLLNIKYKSWYSWLINSFVNGVYAFGFLFMLPQLFVNYKMKSVAHLPWKAFTYKAFNTFIDDIFAFIITMPTSHRLACFRDDVVFLVYLYQRWLYPVDKSRVNEYGESYEEKLKRKPHKE
ncbi:cleft lip and palate transmembrane protein 1-like protein [Python bivittatus]|uniref:Lipid scramblase CLPTM1L n=1 Tax=Python bivittatus TaxID=176946 RepID=A0A9F2KUM1_PYTBI|nr:cleft lip and palate transmembrane protein 1-like protein [Python bivittatus]